MHPAACGSRFRRRFNEAGSVRSRKPQENAEFLGAASTLQ